MPKASSSPRCHARRDAADRSRLVMCLDVPDQTDHGEPSVASPGGEVLFGALREEFWAEALARDYCWVSEGFGGFDRFWRHDPARAARVRDGSAFANMKAE